MLRDAEEHSVNKTAEEAAAPRVETVDAPPPPRRKAKTKIGNKSKKKRKVKTSGKFPGAEGEEQYEVS